MEHDPFMRGNIVSHKVVRYDQKLYARSYPKAFKEEAVALITAYGYTVEKAAVASGVATNIIYRWKANVEKQKASLSLAEDERTQLKARLQDVKTLRVAKAI